MSYGGVGSYGSYDPYDPTQGVPQQQEGAVCQTCFRGVLALQYGVLVCDACGETVAFLEETQEMPFYASGTGTRLREQSQARGTVEIRRVAERQKTVTKEEVDESVDGYIGLFAGLLREGVQRVATRLISPTSSSLPISSSSMASVASISSISSIAEDVWWRWVLASGVLEEHGIEGVVEEVNHSTSERDERHVVFERYLTTRLPFRYVYAILLLSCVVERHPIDAYDVTALFASTGALKATDMSFVERNLASREYLCFDGVPNPVRVYLDMRNLVEVLGIVLPPLNVHGWLARYEEADVGASGRACEGAVGAQVMAGLYGGCHGGIGRDDRGGRKRGVENLLMPWTVLASARGFLGEVWRTGDELLVPRDAQYVMRQVGRERVRAYAKWFVERVGEDEEDRTFDFVLDKMERRLVEMERSDVGGRGGSGGSLGSGSQRGTSTATASIETMGRMNSRERGLPWCYVRRDKHTKLEIDRIVLDNELEVQYDVDGAESAAKARWLEHVAQYEAMQEQAARRAVQLADSASLSE